jgi:hypothetical protein
MRAQLIESHGAFPETRLARRQILIAHGSESLYYVEYRVTDCIAVSRFAFPTRRWLMGGAPNLFPEFLVAQHARVFGRSVREQPYMFRIRGFIKALEISLLLHFAPPSTAGQDVKHGVSDESSPARVPTVRRVAVPRVLGVA